MTQKDPIWPVRELMGYRPLLTAQKRQATAQEASGAGPIEVLERRSMISGPMSIALAAAIAPACEMHWAIDANDDLESAPSDGTVATLAAKNSDPYEQAVYENQPDAMPALETATSDVSEIPRIYTLATIPLRTPHRVNQRIIPDVTGRQAFQQPDLVMQIMASGVAIDFDQAAEISALLNHQMLLPGIVFNPVAGIAALVA